MSPRTRLSMFVAAMVTMGACGAMIGGCAAKPRPPEAQAEQSVAEQPAPPPSRPPAPAAPSNLAVPASASVGETSEERRAAIDQQLNDSLGAFDTKLRDEQQKLARERDGRQNAVITVAASETPAEGATGSQGPHAAESHGDAGGSKGGDGGSNGSDRDSSGSASHRKQGESRSVHSGDLKSDKAASDAANTDGNGASAKEIPDGSDDDIIARRLRKAAV